MPNKKYILFFVISLFVFKVSDAQMNEEDSVVLDENREINLGEESYPAWMVTGAVSSVSGESLKSAFTDNTSKSLNGKIPGLSVMINQNEPGLTNAVSLYVRGRSTYNPGTQPLILIDGYEGSLDQLLPEEIASVEVLKDAAATAIYGDKGANGIILVNTRQGIRGPLQIGLSVRQGFQMPFGLPEYMNAYDYANLYNEASVNDGRSKLYSPQDIAAYKNGDDPYFHPDVNWYDELLKTVVPVSNYNLHFQGGDSIVRYYALLNVLHNGGIYKPVQNLSGDKSGDSYTQYNFRSNVEVNITERLLATLHMGGAVGDKVNLGGENINSIFDLIATIPANAFPVYNPNGSYGGSQSFDNPLGNLQSGYYRSSDRRLMISFGLQQELDQYIPGLKVAVGVSFDNYHISHSDKTRDYRRAAISKTTGGNINYSYYGEETSVEDNESRADRWQNTTVKASLNYSRSFGVHRVDAMLISRISDNQKGYEFFPYRHALFGGRFNYAYKEKYIGNISLAYDGSYEFAKNNKYSFYPAVSLGWIISKEDFLKDNNIIHFLKVRASYGISGNDHIGGDRRFLYNEYYSESLRYYFGAGNSGYSGLTESVVANSNVTREKQKQLNIGIDATLVKKIGIQIDIFEQHRYNILSKLYGTIPAYKGIPTPEMNVGKVDNKGFEATVDYSNHIGAFEFSAALSAWYAKNKIIYNAEALNLNTYLYRTGHQIGQPYVLETLGFFKGWDDIQNSPVQSFGDVKRGDLKYKDQNEDGIIDDNDRYPIGNSDLATFNSALMMDIKYKGIDLSLFFQGISGRTVYLSGKYYKALQNMGNIPAMALGRWNTSHADVATYPSLSLTDNGKNDYQASDFWQRDGSFIKLRSVELGYTIPTHIVSTVGIKSGRIYINGINILSLDHMGGLSDPEILSGQYPALRTFNVGIDVKF